MPLTKPNSGIRSGQEKQQQQKSGVGGMDYLKTMPFLGHGQRRVSESRAGVLDKGKKPSTPPPPTSPFSLSPSSFSLSIPSFAGSHQSHHSTSGARRTSAETTSSKSTVHSGTGSSVSGDNNNNNNTSTATLPSNNRSKPRNRAPRPRLLNTDSLPTLPSCLEGKLNHQSSQLQKLADRVESVNEWIDMDGIVLARLIADIKTEVRREVEDAAATAASTSTSTSRDGTRNRRTATNNGNSAEEEEEEEESHHRQSRAIPTVHFELADATSHPTIPPPPSPSPSPSRSSVEKEITQTRLSTHAGIRELRERIQGMKTWRRELERSVMWQRDECWRVQRALGMPREKKEDPAEVVQQEQAEEQEQGMWGVGGRTWEKGSGRMPTQTEWEVMFGKGRFGWE